MLHVTLTVVAAFFAGADDQPLLKFERQKIGDATYEGCSAFDMNNDGKLVTESPNQPEADEERRTK